ncbi:MAG: branched-chain amino acid ABC transporter permease [Tistrella sp.]|jgi:branched-chain amino acid transport system permease protein|uniref:Branched-chain amino acid ABC transporter permease n=1 Tax=Tistrella mobilis TaxID=171437 RepID=A0A162KWE2_9PROT|nr:MULTISPECIES: branched-chain amino acid ABC transporter permease [Tistrella]KYO52307.1 urea ABC transporter [Tistrella mobilis]MAD37394.1 branched-chain amino acid ABC transporter permease [Tistrella sp.]MAM75516.1 branched-chain amino acid ABC transporter permease [Tistrella sp.]MBA78050.1 branched-chain amino acid ABC transporter permease [Tistrella sp.]HAE50479.1 branched-chain amino acid ABC transporter permease [Tistrella mobilis]
MDLAAVLTLDVLNGVASLILLCTGLAVIFGMMKIINLAHGEFLMLGAYATVVAVEAGINIWIAMLVVSPVFVGLVGLVVERTFIRLLYGRLVDSMLATWGLSLFLVGLITTIFGNTIKSVPSPLGGFTIGAYRSSLYTVFLVAVAITLLGGLWLLMRRTRFGLIARATMQNPDMAAAMGVSPPRVYMATFGLGAAITGLAGGLLAPVAGVLPTMGAAYIAKAFITVVAGGTSIIAGSATASGLFGFINQTASYLTTPVIGEVFLFVAAIILIRLLPQGISGRFFRGSL